MAELDDDYDGNPYYVYVYDLFGNMRQTWNAWGLDVRYVIDGLGRRIARTNANGTLINGYLYDGSRIIGETDAGGLVIAHYVYVNRGNVPDFMVRKVGSVWHTYRLISDEEGSPKLLIDLAGNAIVERYDWDDWGVATSTWPGAYHPFGFAGGLWDGSVGLYRFGARDYRPWEGRWWSKDPSRFAGGVNLYLYANGDPVNYVDVDGRNPVAIAVAVIGAFIIAGALLPSDQPHEVTNDEAAAAIVGALLPVATVAATELLGAAFPSIAAMLANGAASKSCDATNITFQSQHAGRHLAGTGLSTDAVEAAIAQDINAIASSASTSAFWGRVVVQGTQIEYRAFTLPDGTINVGTYYVPGP